jgi:hypothetical protein
MGAALLVLGLGRLRFGLVGHRGRWRRRRALDCVGRNRLRDGPALRVPRRTLTPRAAAARAKSSAAIAPRAAEATTASPATAASSSTATAAPATAATAATASTATRAARTARRRVIARRTAARTAPGTTTTRAAAGTASGTTGRTWTTPRPAGRSRTTTAIAIATAARTIGTAGRARDHPSGSAGRILRTASSAVVVSPAPAARRTHLESSTGAITPGRTLASARTAGAAATATETTATAPTTATTVSVASAAATVATVPTAARLGPRQEIGEIVEIALLLRVRRRILAGHHAHEPHVVGTPAHHLEGLHQAREAIAFDAQLLFDLGGGRCGRGCGRFIDWRGRFSRGAALACRRLGAGVRGGAGVAFGCGLAARGVARLSRAGFRRRLGGRVGFTGGRL